MQAIPFFVPRSVREISPFLASVSLALVGLGGVLASDDSFTTGMLEPSHAYRALRTLDGREFLEVRIVQVDPGGLLFRHRGGAGKVLFSDLSSEWGERYGFQESAAEALEAGRPELKLGENLARPAEGAVAQMPPLTFTYRVRTVLPPILVHSASGCGAAHPWLRHWGRFHPGLAYARFPCRQAAERDFLITSGILPRPPGVPAWRLR